MRLTLRTLLAYLDDILDPADKEELAKKIESSEFAEDLIHRTRDTTRRLRLSAPQVVGTGMGLDPNTVAEYLDNVLPPDQVGDFERICLESDMHLAEVASSHHVLTMVLGEPADVEPASRQRMYALPSQFRGRQLRVEGAHATPGAQPAAAPEPAPASLASTTITGATHQPRAVEIPDYLRSTGWSRYRGWLFGLAALLLLGVTLFLVFGAMGWRGDSSTTVASGSPSTAPPADDRPTAGAPSANSVESSTDNNTIPYPILPLSGDGAMAGSEAAAADARSDLQPSFRGTPDGTMGVAPALPAPLPEPTVPPEIPTPPDHYSQAAPPTGASGFDVPAGGLPSAADPSGRRYGSWENGGPDTAADPAAPAAPPATAADVDPYRVQPAAESPPPYAALPGDAIAATGVTGSAPSPVSPLPDGDPLVAGTEQPTEGAMMPSDPAAGEAPLADAGAPTDVADAPPLNLGIYLGGKTVLVRWDDRLDTWLRMEPRAAVTPGERLLSLPEFRPTVTLASGVHLDLSGGTLVTVDSARVIDAPELAPAAVETPAIDVVYGRIVLINTANSERQIRLRLGPSVSDVRLGRNATLAVEVVPNYVPGNDPREAAAPLSVSIIAPEGDVVWQDAAGELSISTPSQWTIVDGERTEPVRAASPPAWIDQEPIVHRSEHLYGAPVVESSLSYDRPVDNQLLEIFHGGRRREVKSLVARSSIHVGMFAPFVDALRDSDQRANWRTHIETLRSAMALSAESAERLRRTLVEQRGERAAADLYQMLCGYNLDQIGRTPEETRVGALAKLVDWLENDSLDYRVLAAHNLREITEKSLLPNPAGRPAERTLGVRRWRAQLEAGELRAVSDR